MPTEITIRRAKNGYIVLIPTPPSENAPWGSVEQYIFTEWVLALEFLEDHEPEEEA